MFEVYSAYVGPNIVKNGYTSSEWKLEVSFEKKKYAITYVQLKLVGGDLNYAYVIRQVK